MVVRAFSNIFYIPVFSIGLMLGLIVNGTLSSAFLISFLSVGGLVAATWGLWERNKRQYFERRLRSLSCNPIPEVGGVLIGPDGFRYTLSYFTGVWETDNSVEVDPVKLSDALYGRNGWKYESPEWQENANDDG